MARIKMHIPKAKLPFYPPYEVKYMLQNGVSTIISNSREYFVREKSASYAFYVVSLKTRNLLKFVFNFFVTFFFWGGGIALSFIEVL